MNTWAKAFIICLGLLTIASKADETTLASTNPTEMTKTSYEQLAFDSQANKTADLPLVRKIRRDLIFDKYLSTNGKNVKIIIVDKEITLKGPVKSEDEKVKILSIVSKLSNNHTIRNQLEVTKNN